jgi:integrase
VSVRPPSYRLHKPTNQAVVTLDGRDYYLGVYGSATSRAEYDRRIKEWLAAGRRLARAGPAGAASDLTVSELILAYVKFVDGYYVKNGRPTKEAANVRLALRPLRHLYGQTPAAEFGPLALKAVRRAMVEADICRLEVNRRTGRIVRAFKWAVENELVPPSVHQALKAVAWLRKGRTEARESPPVKPVPEPFVDAVRPHVPRQVWAMVELQRLTGMRPGEVVTMRTCDLDISGRVWVYTPGSHKTEHHDKPRTVYLGPRAQEVLRPWLRTDLGGYTVPAPGGDGGAVGGAAAQPQGPDDPLAAGPDPEEGAEEDPGRAVHPRQLPPVHPEGVPQGRRPGLAPPPAPPQRGDQDPA